jgi:hypothetical protein
MGDENTYEKMQKSKRIQNIRWLGIILLAICFGSFVILGLGIFGLWMSIWGWVISVLYAFILLISGFDARSRKVFKKLSAYVLIVFLTVIPVFVVYQTAKY